MRLLENTGPRKENVADQLSLLHDNHCRDLYTEPGTVVGSYVAI